MNDEQNNISGTDGEEKFPSPELSGTSGANKRLLSVIIWILVAVMLALGAFFLTNSYIMRWPILGTSMTPTILDKDDVLLFRTQNVGYDDVIIFYSPELDKELIKRVIGKENDVIKTVFDEKNSVYHIYRNGEPVSEEKIKEPMVGTGGWKESEITVPKNKLYVLGDNRNNSFDSNDGILADVNEVVGIAFLRIGDDNSVSFIN